MPAATSGRRVARRLNRAYHRRAGRRTHDPTGVDVVAADWDLLVVLDACRPDAFRRVVDLPGDVKVRRSRGSHTIEFLWGNFANRTLHDTVYVTGNLQPYVYRRAIDCHYVDHVWVDRFDDDVGTVPPEAVADAAIVAGRRFPRKRVVAHFLQPHYPFFEAPDFDYGTMAFWDAAADGTVEVTASDLRDWHEANLERALPAIRRLLKAFDGRAVITADHGTALGERVRPVPIREWGHPWGIYAEPLVTVPWLVRPGGTRRDVVADIPLADEEYDEAVVEERLAELGLG